MPYRTAGTREWLHSGTNSPFPTLSGAVNRNQALAPETIVEDPNDALKHDNSALYLTLVAHLCDKPTVPHEKQLAKAAPQTVSTVVLENCLRSAPAKPVKRKSQ
jgi:hypothetical protein